MPRSVGVDKFRIVFWVTSCTTELVAGLVLCAEVERIHTHPDPYKPFITSCFDLLQRITVTVIDEMFWLPCAWHREGPLDHVLLFASASPSKRKVNYNLQEHST